MRVIAELVEDGEDMLENCPQSGSLNDITEMCEVIPINDWDCKQVRTTQGDNSSIYLLILLDQEENNKIKLHKVT